jgi:hypothetical protein
MTTLHLEPTAGVTVIDAGGATWNGTEPLAAAVVLSNGGDLRAELWPANVPVLVVMPPWADPGAVLAAFALGADACIRTTSEAEIDAHLAALLRRQRRVA